MHMVRELRTALARLIVRHLTRPRPLVVRAWLRLAADTQEVEHKRRCLKAVLEIHPDDEPASLAFLVLDQRRPTS